MQSQPIYDPTPKFRFTNRAWFWDSRKDPFGPGPPVWRTYPDHISVVIEKHFFAFLNKITTDEEVEIFRGYVVNVKKCMQYCSLDRFKQRPVKRGKPNQRGDRPSEERFGGNSFALQFKAVGGGGDDGCYWLGKEFQRTIGWKGGKYVNFSV